MLRENAFFLCSSILRHFFHPFLICAHSSLLGWESLHWMPRKPSCKESVTVRHLHRTEKHSLTTLLQDAVCGNHQWFQAFTQSLFEVTLSETRHWQEESHRSKGDKVICRSTVGYHTDAKIALGDWNYICMLMSLDYKKGV